MGGVLTYDTELEIHSCIANVCFAKRKWRINWHDNVITTFENNAEFLYNIKLSFALNSGNSGKIDL